MELTAASGDFFRSVGYGFDQVSWSGSGGFSNNGTGTRVVNLGANGVKLTWGVDAGFLGTSKILQLGSGTANGVIDFQNAIDVAHYQAKVTVVPHHRSDIANHLGNK